MRTRSVTARLALAEIGTLAALTFAFLAIAFAPAAWGPWPWLAAPPLLALAGALRRPRHGWLVALEAWLAFVLADRAYAAWGPPPAGPAQPLPDALVESLLILPLAWALVALGRGLVGLVDRARPSRDHRLAA